MCSPCWLPRFWCWAGVPADAEPLDAGDGQDSRTIITVIVGGTVAPDDPGLMFDGAPVPSGVVAPVVDEDHQVGETRLRGYVAGASRPAWRPPRACPAFLGFAHFGPDADRPSSGSPTSGRMPSRRRPLPRPSSVSGSGWSGCAHPRGTRRRSVDPCSNVAKRRFACRSMWRHTPPPPQPGRSPAISDRWSAWLVPRRDGPRKGQITSSVLAQLHPHRPSYP
jgi:hypothetical protein